MDFWIIEERDTYLRTGQNVCHVENLEPLNIEPSNRKCPACGAVLEPGLWMAPRKAHPSAANCGDLLLGGGFELILSTNTRDHFVADGISGFVSFDPVEMIPPAANAYVAARPHVAVTRLDEKASNLRWRRAPTCDVCRLGVRERVEVVHEPPEPSEQGLVLEPGEGSTDPGLLPDGDAHRAI